MGLLNFLKRNTESKNNMQWAKMLNGYSPVFSQFGENIYSSDIVQACIRILATEMSKLQPKHIRTDEQSKMQDIVRGSINRLLKYGANPLMTTTDFLESITYLREVHKNAFIYPTYREEFSNGSWKRIYTAFYPLNPTMVEFLEDDAGQIFISMQFKSGDAYTLPYKDIIHWRKDYGANEFLGGDEMGQSNSEALLKLLKANDTAVQGLEKGVKASFAVNGILKMTTMSNNETQEKVRKEFEKKMANSESGMLAMDLKSEYIPIKIEPKLIDKDTIEFLDKRILSNYGIPLPIFYGDFTEEQYQSFYEKTLEPMIMSLGRCFSRALFTNAELEDGNEVIFYHQGLMYTNMKNKIAVVDILGSRGALTNNDILGLFGYPPYEGGNVREKSLNYINTEIADRYQLSKTHGKETKKYEKDVKRAETD